MMMVPLAAYEPHQEALSHAVRYQPCYGIVIRSCLELIPSQCLAYPFIDLGCGKGKPLLIAAQFGFARLAGVDINPELIKICERNLERIRSRLSHKIEVELKVQDVRQYSFPSAPLTCFLYNPFDAVGLRSVLRNLAQAAPGGREVYLIYVNNCQEELVLQFAEKLADVMSPPEMKAALYRIRTARDKAGA